MTLYDEGQDVETPLMDLLAGHEAILTRPKEVQKYRYGSSRASMVYGVKDSVV